MKKDIIYPIVRDAIMVHGTLKEPFTATDVRRVARGWAYTRYFSYLAHNCTENKTGSEALFVRVARGKYRLTE